MPKGEEGGLEAVEAAVAAVALVSREA